MVNMFTHYFAVRRSKIFFSAPAVPVGGKRKDLDEDIKTLPVGYRQCFVIIHGKGEIQDMMTRQLHIKHSIIETAFVLVFTTFLTVTAVGERAFAAGIPEFDEVLSEESVRSLSGKYDKDGYFLSDYAFNRNDGFFAFMQLFYFTPQTPVIQTLPTVVHEAFHKYTRNDTGLTVDGKEHESMKVYTGNGKGIKVHFTRIFRSKDIAESMPKRCRDTSSRFSLYVEDAGGTMLSDWDGIYGLLNEFGGYCWGMHDNVKLFAYRDRFADTLGTWQGFIEEGESDRLAYAEFKYYILHYLRYAKEHHPAIYKKIMANAKFKKAYTVLEKQFSQDIAQYEKQVGQVRLRIKRAGGNVSEVDKLTKDTSVRKSYDVLIKEIGKKTYRDIEGQLQK